MSKKSKEQITKERINAGVKVSSREVKHVMNFTSDEQKKQTNLFVEIKTKKSHFEESEKRFKIGDKLKTLPFHKEEYNIDYVTITSINEENKVYHWEVKNPIGLGGTMHSGYFFNESELYEK